MDLSFTSEQKLQAQGARTDSRRDASPHCEESREYGHFDPPEQQEWQKILYGMGWGAMGWPKEVGGSGLDPTSRFIISEELALAGAPEQSPFGVNMVGPLIIQFGNPEQKARFLPKILKGEEVWCQGLLGADRGAATWPRSSSRPRTTRGQLHHQRSDRHGPTTPIRRLDLRARAQDVAARSRAASALLVDMKSEGLRAEPFVTLGGTLRLLRHVLRQRQSAEGELSRTLNGGWSAAKALLGHERVTIGGVGAPTRMMRNLKQIARSTIKDGKPLIEDPIFRAKVAKLEMKIESLRMVVYRTIAGAALGHAPGPESSFLKIRGTELQQAVGELSMEAMGYNALNWFGDGVPAHQHWVASNFCYYRAATIYGGSNEIQRNVIAKGILRLPGA